MTIERWTFLLIAQNVLLLREGVPSEDQLIQFLWTCSRNFRCKFHAIRRAWFMFRFGFKFSGNYKAQQDLVAAIRVYVEETFWDRSHNQSQGFEPSYFSDPAYLAFAVACETGWQEMYIVKQMPLKRIFQYLRIKRWIAEIPLGNKSDDILYDPVDGLSCLRGN